MVRIVDYKRRINSIGEEFFALILEGDLTMVQSAETGRLYATAKQCSITSTFDEETCKAMIGRQMPGQIVKVECEPYSYTVEQTGEILTLNHRYEYKMQPTHEEAVFETNQTVQPA